MISTPSGNSLRFLRDPDVQLMLRTKAGDVDAFEQLVHRYQDRLIAIYSRLLHDQETAYDLTQETFLRIYRARNRYQPSARFSTWLYRIAANLASNSRRNAMRRKEVPLQGRDMLRQESKNTELLSTDGSDVALNRQLSTQELQTAVRDAIHFLSERQQMALLLHRYEGLSYSDISESMGVSEDAVKSMLARARQRLRERLKPYLNRVADRPD